MVSYYNKVLRQSKNQVKYPKVTIFGQHSFDQPLKNNLPYPGRFLGMLSLHSSGLTLSLLFTEVLCALKVRAEFELHLYFLSFPLSTLSTLKVFVIIFL